MEVSFADKTLERLYFRPKFTGGYGGALVKAFRKKVQFLAASKDEQDLRNWKSLHYERLKGNRSHQWSIRLNDQWRLIVQREEGDDGPRMIVVAIEDYHK